MKSAMAFTSVSPRVRLVVETDFRCSFSFFLAVELLN